MKHTDNEHSEQLTGKDDQGTFHFILADKKSRTIQLRIESAVDDVSDEAFINVNKKELTEIRDMLTRQIDRMK